MRDLLNRLAVCRRKLQYWSRGVFPNFRKVIDLFRHQLNCCMSGVLSLEKLNEAEILTRQIEEAWASEESYWWQISRITWLNCGDRNTKFFHNSVIQRRQRNKVLRLKNDNGIWLEESSAINKAFSGFYQNLFCSVSPRPMDQALTYVKEVVTAEDNDGLMRQVTDQEIEESVFQIGANKAPGPDGYSASEP
ncbi:hypothetical protein K1719_023853 [Acacia pycnantha]|nr:hypothetical protein K1719_023853 [Acacia pycnantha]